MPACPRPSRRLVPRHALPALLLAALGILHASDPSAQSPHPQLAILDTDIGDDIDDVFALGLALQSPELRLLGITTAWGNTPLRARLVDRLLAQTGHTGIPVLQGIERHKIGEGAFSQAAWASQEPARPHPDAVNFLLQTIRAHPGQVTLIALAPLTNLAAAIDRDPATFRQLQRIVLMGGSIHRGYDGLDFPPSTTPTAEYNIAMDPAAARKVFTAGVPLDVMPLDSTQLKLDEVKRQLLFVRSTPLTDALTLLYQQWSRQTRQTTPTMYDPVAVAFALKPELCPVTPMHLTVDDAGNTRPTPGPPNTFVCLHADAEAFFNVYLSRVLQSSPPVSHPLPPATPAP